MKTKEENFSIINKTKGRLPSLPFVLFKNKILGTKYDLGVVFIGEEEMRKLNKKYRNIDKPTDILSFPLDKKSGEIFICEKKAKLKAKEFEREDTNFIAFLFIYGCVHLRGYDHGNKMESVEEKYRKVFKI